MTRVAVLNGPNLDLLGLREPEVYGKTTFAELEAMVRREAAALGVTLEWFQTNHEGELVDAIHAARRKAAAIIINPGAFTHYAWSIHDALAAFSGPVIEVHISNPARRGAASEVATSCLGTVSGFGIAGYALALRGLTERTKA